MREDEPRKPRIRLHRVASSLVKSIEVSAHKSVSVVCFHITNESQTRPSAGERRALVAWRPSAVSRRTCWSTRESRRLVEVENASARYKAIEMTEAPRSKRPAPRPTRPRQRKAVATSVTAMRNGLASWRTRGSTLTGVSNAMSPRLKSTQYRRAPVRFPALTS